MSGAEIASEVAAALAEAGEATGSGALVSCLRKILADPSETARETPWDNDAPAYSYSDLTGIDDLWEIRDRDGLTGETRRTLTVNGTGATPAKADYIAVGVARADVDANTVWTEINEVRPFSPGGTVLLYELELAR